MERFPIEASGPMFKRDSESRVERKAKQKAAKDTNWRRVCEAVDARDKKRCRVCGRRGDPEATSLLKKLHRHHIIYRSAGGADSDTNVVSVCAKCHDVEHRHELMIRGTGQAIELWRVGEDGRWYLANHELSPGVWAGRD